MSDIGHNYNQSMNVPRELEFAAMHSELSSQARHIIHVLAKLMLRDGGGCKPSIDTLVFYTGLGRSTIIRKLKEVDEWGRIERKIKSRTEGTSYSPNIDLIEQDMSNQSARRTPIEEELPSLLVSERHQGLVSEGHQEGHSLVPEGNQESKPWCQSDTVLVSEGHPTKDITKENKKRKNTKKEKKKIGYTSAFEEFYQAYPKRTTKAESFRVWQDLSVEDQAWALASLPAYKALLAEDGGWRKPKDPVRYLRHRTFEDFAQDGSTSDKPWGWWRELGVEKYRNLGEDWWRRKISEIKPNGSWPWCELGPPPGHPECLLPENAIAAYGNKYTDQVQQLNKQFGGQS